MMKNYTSIKSFVILPGIFLLIAAAPFSCNVVKEGGVFKSTNFGEAWEQKVVISNSKKQTLSSHEILGMEIDPFDPRVIYAGTENGLYRTSSGADNWELVQDEKKNPDARASVLGVKISPQNPNLIYAAIFQGNFGRLLRRTDPASPWEQVYIASNEGVSITCIEADKTAPNIYIGTSEGAVLKSADFGLSWKITGFFDKQIESIRVNPDDSQIVYVLVSQKGLFKSADQGANWQLLPPPGLQPGSSPGFSRGSIQDFFLGSRDRNSLYAVTNQGIFLSSDGGQNWNPFSSLISPEAAPISAIVQDGNNPATFYYGAGSIVYRTQNNGQTWTVHQLPSKRQVNLIKIDPRSSNIIYVGLR